MTLQAVNHIAVVGAGTMGQGIAQLCAASGYQVMLYDVQPQIIQQAVESIRQNLESLVLKGKLDAASRHEILQRIKQVDDFRQLQVDLVIEAAVEKLDIKQKIFSELEKINGKNCLFVSNTSSIPITQIASALKHKDRFAGLHFFNPAPVMKLIELIQGKETSAETTDRLHDVVRKLGKHAVLAQDSPGFIVNRVARHYYLEALQLLGEGVADITTIDKLMRSAGFKLGPFELMDLIGVDTNLAVTKSIYHEFHQDPKFRPSIIQQQLVDAGHFGRKTGKGFYEYGKDKK
jgi:3-hydroxybutyryl-CoA dehydrogenase